MGPQLDSCGRLALGAAGSVWPPALQWGRNLTVAEGAFVRHENLWYEALLQWGRNLTVAEGLDVRTAGRADGMLQWGRNLTVAEGRGRARGVNQDRCFNGAAT